MAEYESELIEYSINLTYVEDPILNTGAYFIGIIYYVEVMNIGDGSTLIFLN